MNRDAYFKKLGKRKFLEGLPEQITEWGEAFAIRNYGARGFYISWKSHKEQVEGTGTFIQYSDAKHCLVENWKRFIDEQFEREVLLGSEQDTADANTED